MARGLANETVSVCKHSVVWWRRGGVGLPEENCATQEHRPSKFRDHPGHDNYNIEEFRGYFRQVTDWCYHISPVAGHPNLLAVQDIWVDIHARCKSDDG